ncbi:MAG: 1-acyl-sn-glycerol-3-phosphate acyltransferase [Minwuiales bacterium]|nr:1-acyl-sn-glycerol-3-phosphate acyltransferase [Minwuiales bacterium]
MSSIRAVVVFALVVLMTVVLMPVQIVATIAGSRLAVRLPLLWHAIASRLMRIRVVVRGAMAMDRPVLFVCNHISWLDIIVMGKALPACFVAKSEVASWPFFGRLAKLQRSVFIERRRHATANHRDTLQQRLEAGDNLILFAEGSSGDGIHILPFKSGLLAVAERRIDGRALTVQPVTIAYSRVDGVPALRSQMPGLAWYGDMDLVPHLWGILTGGPIVAELVMHAPVTLDQFGSRKALSTYCRERIVEGMSEILSGRPGPAGGRAAEAPVAPDVAVSAALADS